ncbi:MAG: hypothetical protein ACE5KU_04275 [Nitrososphaerales archaeon]
MQRTDLVTAYEKVVNTLKEGQPYTLRRLATETGLNHRTIIKAVKLLRISEDFLKTSQIEISDLNKMHIIKAKPRVGLASLPGPIQNMIIRTAYFPTISREEEILTHLHLKGATNPRKAISITEDRTLAELVEAEHIAKTRDERYYLTEDGQMIAEGATEIYSELLKEL